MRSLLCVLACVAASPVIGAEPADQNGPIRVACVGDSITYGGGIENREKNSYPVQLDRILGDMYDVRNFGVGGATLQKRGDKPYWTLDAFKDVSEFKPHIVVIKLGTNDSKPHNWHDPKLFKIDLLAMVNHFRELPDGPQVFLCTPVPVHRDNFKIREEVVRDKIVPIVKEVSKEKDVPLVDLYTALKKASDDFPDGVHPNANGAKLIAEAVAKALKEHAKQPKTDDSSR